MANSKKVCLIGSCNFDITYYLNENIHFENIEDITKIDSNAILDKKIVFGGKAANQAISIKRASDENLDVRFIGYVGKDGQCVIDNFNNNGINTNGIETLENESTDKRYVLVKEGVNFLFNDKNYTTLTDKITIETVDKYMDIILDSNILILQLKIPRETTKYIINICEKNKIPVVLNGAPENKIKELFDYDLINKITYVILNEKEAYYFYKNMIGEYEENKIVDAYLKASNEDKNNAYNQIISKYHNVIVTVGKDGTYIYNGENCKIENVEIYGGKCIDDTGAGDTFIGAFASKILQNVSIKEAVIYGNKAAGIKVQCKGAQAGMPTYQQINEYYN